ncbi:MAG: biotin/lipoyl-binding protein [Bacteroidales bacterium]|nr:biotin/lipoyl-binding protein [Bacteroidales bacterium]MCF8387611.1 biotin/lipoyl-binding protein [Bacteroidales bacterium]MCF8397286.1 biotin/lipoyl-binding protein [Bacteroidales bacterium]
MSLEVNINGKTREVEIEQRQDNKACINLDGKHFEVDIVEVEPGIYSIIHNDISYNVELFQNGNGKKYTVNTLYKTYDVEIFDAEAKYLKYRKKDFSDDGRTIASPMPGKVVKIPVKVGDKLKAGDTAIIVSAMKMESEYKVKKDRVVTDILVKEGQTITANQPLVVIE